MFMEGLRRAAEVEKEIRRTLNGVLKHNISLLYFYFDQQQDDQIIIIVDKITCGLTDELNNWEFIKELKVVTDELMFFFDAFYAHKPFVLMLFKFIVVNIHKKVRSAVNEFWEKKWKVLNAGEVISLLENIRHYIGVLSYWGIEEIKIGEWIPSLLKVFINKLFENCKKILANIIFDLRNRYHTDNGKIVSKAFENLEAHIVKIFDHYERVPFLEAADLLLELCSATLLIFLLNVRRFVRIEDFPLEIYIALINNNMFHVIKNLLKRVHSTTKSQLSLNELKEKINEKFMGLVILDIEKMSFKKVVLFFKNQIKIRFFGVKTFFEFNFSKKLTETLKELEAKSSQIDNKYTVSDLYGSVFNSITDIYFELFLKFSDTFSSKDHSRLTSKVKSDTKLLLGKVDKLNTEDANSIRFKVSQFLSFVEAEDIDKVMITIMNMKIFYKSLISPRIIDRLLKSKVLFARNSLTYMADFLKPALSKQIKKSKCKERFLSVFLSYTFVLNFIRNLSWLKRESSHPKKTSSRRQPITRYVERESKNNPTNPRRPQL